MIPLLLTTLIAIWSAWKLGSFLLQLYQVRAKTKSIGGGYAPVIPTGLFGIPFFIALEKSYRNLNFAAHLKGVQDDFSKTQGREVSTYALWIASNHVWMTTDPRNIQAILATQFEDFDIGPVRRGSFLPALGDGIFIQDGKAWEHSRALIRPSFVKDQVADLDQAEQHVKNLIRVLTDGPRLKDGWTALTDIMPLFFRLTIDSATDFLFGESTESQLSEAGLERGPLLSMNEQTFSHAFDMTQAHMSFRMRIGTFYWMWFPKEMKDYIRTVDTFMSRWVNKALEGGVSKPENKRYVFLDELATRTQDPNELKAQLLNILLAGRDTTAGLLSWLFVVLLRHPEVFNKLREVVIKTFGTFEHPNISYDNLKDCRYLRYCLNETLRLYPIVPFNIRVANKMTTLPYGGGPDGESPIVIRPGGTVDYSVHVMHRRKDLWGEDADEFRPERWESRRPGWQYLPFNGGPRICPGQTLALTNASYVTVRLLQKFDRIEAPVEDLNAQIKHDLRLTDKPGQPVRLRMHVATE